MLEWMVGPDRGNSELKWLVVLTEGILLGHVGLVEHWKNLVRTLGNMVILVHFTFPSNLSLVITCDVLLH